MTRAELHNIEKINHKTKISGEKPLEFQLSFSVNVLMTCNVWLSGCSFMACMD